ncbi:MAG: hypothetical protein AAGD18_14660 [Actinomycetota bacterium]
MGAYPERRMSRRRFITVAAGTTALAGAGVRQLVVADDSGASTATAYVLEPRSCGTSCGVCNACRRHADNKLFLTAAAADGGRAHPGCRCVVRTTEIDAATLQRLRDVDDDLASGGSLDRRWAAVATALVVPAATSTTTTTTTTTLPPEAPPTTAPPTTPPPTTAPPATPTTIPPTTGPPTTTAPPPTTTAPTTTTSPPTTAPPTTNAAPPVDLQAPGEATEQPSGGDENTTITEPSTGLTWERTPPVSGAPTDGESERGLLPMQPPASASTSSPPAPDSDGRLVGDRIADGSAVAAGPGSSETGSGGSWSTLAPPVVVAATAAAAAVIGRRRLRATPSEEETTPVL